MEFEILQATSVEDDAKIDMFVGEVFLQDLPLLRIFGIDTESINIEDKPKQRDFSLKAVDQSGEIVGIAINAEQSESVPPSKELSEVAEFVKFIRTADFKWEVNGSVELSILAVREDWRGRGVARRLVEESTRIAQSLGYAAIKICCISEFTAKITRRLGWREIYRMAYADYPALSGRKVELTPTPPHDSVYGYVNEF